MNTTCDSRVPQVVLSGYIWLMKASKCREEHACRFCHQRLPDWQTILTPQEDHLPPQCLPTMSVTFNDEVKIAHISSIPAHQVSTKIAASSSGKHIRAWHAGACSLPCMLLMICLPYGMNLLLSV